MFDEVRSVVAVLSQNEINQYLVWREGWSEWKNLAEVDVLHEPIVRTMETKAPAIKNELNLNENQNLTYLPLVDLDDESSVVDHRAKKRFNKKVTISIRGQDGQVFTTQTKDVSVGGFLLEKSVPDWVVGYFRITVAKPDIKQKVELTCSLVENQAPDERFRIAILPFENVVDEKNLEVWLAA